MESLGEKLRTTRESKGISLDQVSVDTKLAVRYIEALESENFSAFPGEAYITGFIRNYSAYLELNADEILSMYRAIKVQEQPIPVEQLLKKPSALPKIAMGAVVVFVVLALAVIVVLILTNRPADSGRSSAAPRTPVRHSIDGDAFEGRLFSGDTVAVSGNGDSGDTVIKLTAVNGNDVIVNVGGADITVGLSRPASVDLDGDEVQDLRIEATDFATGNIDMGVLFRIERYSATSFVPEIEVVPEGAAAVTARASSTVIFASPNPYPFTFQANFQAGNMFRWEVISEPSRTERNERFFQRQEELIVPQLQNGVRLWTSNAVAGQFQVIGGGRTVSLELGGPGEVVVADVRWVRGDDGVFRLMLLRLED